MKYNAKELAAMAVRNSMQKDCGAGDGCKVTFDPAKAEGCIAKVFEAPLATLAQVEQDYEEARKKLDHANRLIEMFAQNLGGAVQVADPGIIEAAENYTGRKLAGPAGNN